VPGGLALFSRLAVAKAPPKDYKRQTPKPETIATMQAT